MRRDAGFTLLEILIVLAILGVVIGLVAMRAPGHGGYLQTRAAAGALAQTLRQARASAMERSEVVTVAIDPANHSFAPDRGAVKLIDPSVPIDVLAPSLPGPGTVRLIRFSPDGSASGGGVVLGAGHRRLLVAVEWMTGQVKVSDAQ